MFEEVLVEPVSGSTYRLLRSPGLVLGMAADDVFELLANGDFKVLRRGQNLCVQIFSRGECVAIEKTATPLIAKLEGRLDGQSEKELVYTIPFAAGFAAIEGALNELGSLFADYSWYYGNVYDPSDGVTPLNWWKS